jgi:hypothetical protein
MKARYEFMNDKFFPTQALPGNGKIDLESDADNLILILKPSGGVMVAEKINPDEAGSDNQKLGMKKLCDSSIYLVVAILSIALSLWISPPGISDPKPASEIREAFAGNRSDAVPKFYRFTP